MRDFIRLNTVNDNTDISVEQNCDSEVPIILRTNNKEIDLILETTQAMQLANEITETLTGWSLRNAVKEVDTLTDKVDSLEEELSKYKELVEQYEEHQDLLREKFYSPTPL